MVRILACHVHGQVSRLPIATNECYGRRLRTGEGRVVLDAVVRVEVAEVEGVGPVVAAEHVRGVLGHEEAERRREVVRRADRARHVSERDPPPRMRQDTWRKQTDMS